MELGLQIGAVVALFGSIMAVVYWVSNHINKKNLHPEADKIVFLDFCRERKRTADAEHGVINANVRRIEDCAEIEIKNLSEKLDATKNDLCNKIDKFENTVVSLIKKNGNN